MKLVTVIISIYNEPLLYIKKSMNSILNQTYKNLEVIVVLDNPNRDDIRKFLIDYKEKDNRVTIIFNNKNMGLAKSLNKALKLSKGQYIARMDADDISESIRIEKELNILLKEKVDMVSSNVIDIDNMDNVLGSKTDYPVSNINIKRFLKYGDPMPHPTWLGRKEVFSKLNGYRNISACEDYDFLIRAAIYGYKFRNVKDPLLLYRINYDGISKTNNEKQLLTTFYLQEGYKKKRILNIKKLNNITFLRKKFNYKLTLYKCKNKICRKLCRKN